MGWAGHPAALALARRLNPASPVSSKLHTQRMCPPHPSLLSSFYWAFINSLDRKATLDVYVASSSSTNSPTTTPHALEVMLELNDKPVVFIDTRDPSKSQFTGHCPMVRCALHLSFFPCRSSISTLRRPCHSFLYQLLTDLCATLPKQPSTCAAYKASTTAAA